MKDKDTVKHISMMSDDLKLIHIFSVDSTDVCGIKKESGPCFASIQRWHFDSESGMCRKFTYGGCRGNGNNFISELECQSSCRGTLDFFKYIFFSNYVFLCCIFQLGWKLSLL